MVIEKREDRDREKEIGRVIKRIVRKRERTKGGQTNGQ